MLALRTVRLGWGPVPTEVEMHAGCFVGAVGLAACAEPVERERFGEVDGTELVVGDPLADFPERVRVLENASARLLPEGPVLRGGQRTVEPQVVVDPGPRPRISVDAGDVRVLLYLDRAALQPRVVAQVDGTGPEGDGRVVFARGTSIEVLDRDEDRVQVSYTSMDFTVEAWLPRSAVDEVWPHDVWRDVRHVQPNERAPDGVFRSVVGETDVVDAPWGHPLVRLGGSARRSLGTVRVVGDEVRAHVPVELFARSVWIVGWVHVDDLRRDDLLGWRMRSLGGCLGDLSVRLQLADDGAGAIIPKGALLRAGAGGPIVAVATLDIPVSDDARIDGATLTRVTPFGEVELWAGPADVH